MGFNLKGSSNYIIHFEHPNIKKVVRFNFQCGPCSHLGFQTCYFNCFKFSTFIIKKLPINNLEHFLSCKFQYTNFPLRYFILLVVISSIKYPLTLFLHLLFLLFIISICLVIYFIIIIHVIRISSSSKSCSAVLLALCFAADTVEHILTHCALFKAQGCVSFLLTIIFISVLDKYLSEIIFLFLLELL